MEDMVTKSKTSKPPFEVGYGKPPKNSQFKPGRSGNPKGRPKAGRNLRTDVREVLDMPVSITENGKKKKFPTQLVTVLKLRERALSGDGRALDRLLDLAARYNNDEPPPPADEPLGAEDEEILASYRARYSGTDSSQKDDAGAPKPASGESDPPDGGGVLV